MVLQSISQLLLLAIAYYGKCCFLYCAHREIEQSKRRRRRIKKRESGEGFEQSRDFTVLIFLLAFSLVVAMI
jgi:hypothetical protein